MRADLHFWERRIAKDLPATDRRRERKHETNCIRVAVSDTGAGIAAEHHQEIFEDFVRVDRSSSGMGLGLAIAKRLVQAHRGKIWVDSEVRRGCTFHGLAFNVNMDLEPFQRINPCGFQGLTVTQMLDLGGPSRLADVETVLIAELAQQLGLKAIPAAPPLTFGAGAETANRTSVPT